MARFVPLPAVVLIAWMTLPVSSAFAACNTTGVAPADVTVTCADTVTTNTTNNTSPVATSDRIQSFNANVIGQVNSGVTVSGFGLALTSTKAGGSASITNNGTISITTGAAALALTGNGGGISYTGSGDLTGLTANSSGLNVVDNGSGAGAVMINATGGTFTAVGNSVFGISAFTNNTAGVSITTSGGHAINLVDTFSGSSNDGIIVSHSGASGDVVINSGSHIFASGGVNSNGSITAIELFNQGSGKIDVTSTGVIDLTGTTGAGSGVAMTQQGTGIIIAQINANITGGGGGVGVQATFQNAASTATGSITVAAGVSINDSIAMGINGGNGTHVVSVVTGTGSSLTSAIGGGIQVQGSATSLDLTNRGSITTTAATAGVIVTGGKITGTNTGSISGATGIIAGAAGSNFTNAGVITGTGGNAIQFTGNGNTLTLQNGTNITGLVTAGVSGNILQLGGTTGSPTFDASSIGVQYLAFSTFNKIDSGTWTLSGTGNQTWNVSGGTLAGTNTSQGNVVLSNNSIFDFNQSTNGTYGGVVSGAGSLAKDGTGAVTLSGVQTYNGNTTINGGSLTMGIANALPGGTAVTVGAAGTLNLAGFNLTIASLTGAAGSALQLGAGALTTGGNDASTTFSGAITGSGGLNKTGTGAFTLAGASAAYTGSINVTGGTLIVNGDVGSAALTTIGNGTTLTGIGTVGNTQINAGGTFNAGNGTAGSSMSVNGSLVLNAASTYMVQLNPASSSQVNVTGTATLNGATLNATFANGSYISKKYTVLTAGTVSGTFNPVFGTTNLPSGFHTSLSYDATHAYLDLTLNFVPPPAFVAPGTGSSLNVNQQNVANAIINFFNANGGIAAVYGGLTPAGLTQASGELGTGSQQTTFDAMSQFMGVMTDPFITGRGDAFSSGGGASGYASEGTKRNPNDALAAIYTKAPPVVPFERRWSVWAAGFGGSQTTDGNAAVGSNTATSRIYGGAVGADYRISPSTIAGFALAGGGTNFSVANNAGTGRSDLFQAGAFIRHNVGAAYLLGAAAYGWQDVTTDRTVTIAGIDQLRAKFSANAWSGRIEGGYRFVSGIDGIGITPYAAGQFTTFDLPAYAEQVLAGTNAFALAYGARSVTDSRSELGLRTDKAFAMQDGVLTLRGRGAWAHDFNPNRSIGSTFQALPGASFVVNGAAQASDSALVTGSAEMKWISGWSTAAVFEGEFSNVTRSYAGKGVVRYAW